jgi:mono/diheme cytochrome c family protein
MHRPRLLAGLIAFMSSASVCAFADEPGGVVKTPPPVTGEQVYRQVCQACHMANGMGGVGAAAIPALAKNPRLAAASYPILIVLKGRGAMPWFDDMLSPAQVAAVVGYVRTNFGNAYPKPVTAEEVSKLDPHKTAP